MVVVTSDEASPLERLVAELAGLPADDLLSVVEEALVRQQPAGGSAALATLVQATLRADAQLEALVGGPRAVHESVRDAFADLAIRAEAQRAVLDVDMLTSSAVAEALGIRGRNPREAASRLRRSGRLLGVLDRSTRSYVFPAFQVDPVRGRVHPVVEVVNQALGAAEDPWGVGSWWVSEHPRLGDRAPRDLVGAADEGDLLVLVGGRPVSEASDARDGAARR